MGGDVLARVPSRFCGPTRASLLSGRLPVHVSQQNFRVIQREGAVPLGMATLADKLTAAGYESHIIGKWHLSSSAAAWLPVNRGFASSFGTLGGSSDKYTMMWPYRNDTAQAARGARWVDLWRNHAPAHGENTLHSTVLFTKEAHAIVQHHPAAGRTLASTSTRTRTNTTTTTTINPPLFLLMSYLAPHGPFQAPLHLTDMYPRTTFEASAPSVDAAVYTVDVRRKCPILVALPHV